MNREKVQEIATADEERTEIDIQWLEKTNQLSAEITRYLDSYQFNLAAERLYEFAWHEFADNYIEDVKNRITNDSYTVLVTIYVTILKLLHPFMPFITEEIYQKLPEHTESLMIAKWPEVS
jgi:valyl-tRNA synthetase